MAKTLLNLKLNYKGKNLDIAKYGRDFTNKLFIGSNKYLFWQILDPKFPDKHLFLTSTGGDFYLQLVPGSKVSCVKGGSEVDQAYLTSNKILTGNSLKLSPDMTGSVALTPDWEVKFEFSEPWVSVLTEEQRQVVAQYSRRAELSSTERFNRGLMLGITALAILFLIVYDLWLKPADTGVADLEARLQQLATRVTPAVEAQSSTFEAEEPETPPETGQEQAQAAQQARPGTPTGQTQGTAGSAAANFGLGDFNASATQRPMQVVAVTGSEVFGATRPGGRPGGSGATGPGASGPGTGAASNFNPGATSVAGADLGAVATRGPNVAGSSIRPQGGVAVVTGDASRVAPIGRPIAQTAAQQSVRTSFTTQSVQTVSEGSIQSAPAESQATYATIAARVNSLKGRINQAFVSEYNVQPQAGSVAITLYVGADGSVRAADVVPQSGDLTTQFLQKVQQQVLTWRFSVSEMAKYRFVMQFRRN
ncbi:MAG: hypothetical protein V3576_02620 [Candidatus Cloacimonadota bacterium]